MSRHWQWPLYRREVYALLAGLACLWLLLTTMFQTQPGPVVALASAVSDSYYRFGPHRAHPDVVFVAIDHAAVKRFGRWPWPRDQLAAGIARMREARVIALDMVFSEPTEAARDAALAAALARTQNVGGFFFNGARPSTLSAEARQQLANAALLEVNGPAWLEARQIEISIPAIAAGLTTQATLNTLPDGDARFRHYPAAFVLDGLIQPSLGVQSLQLFSNLSAHTQPGDLHTLHVGNTRVALDRHGFTRLNFYPEEGFTTLSFADLFAPDFAPQQLAGKLVVLGVTEAGVTDIRATPLGQYPGPLMHATFMANVLDGLTLRELSTAEMATVLGVTLLLVSLALPIRASSVRVLFYPTLALLAWVLGLWLYRSAGIWLETGYTLAAILLAALVLEASLFAHARRHTAKLRTAFSSYLPPDLVGRIVEDPDKLKLGGEKKEITVLFSDIRGFTSLSEHVAPETLAEIMNDYFQPMTEAIFAQGGTLDKYIGDAIMALFNAPLDQPDHALAACRAAIAMQQAQLRINAHLATRGLPPLRTGIGINCGPAIVGNLGSSIRFNYTAIGDVVNLASRFESATKKLGVDIIIGESLYRQVQGRLPCAPLGTIEIPGKDACQTVYTLNWKDA